MEPQPNLETLDRSATLDSIGSTNEASIEVDLNDAQKDLEPITLKQQAHESEPSTDSNREISQQKNGEATKQPAAKMQMSPQKKNQKWTPQHLFNNTFSEMAKSTSLKGHITFQLLNLLSQDDLDELCTLLPPSDINFIRYEETGEVAEEVIPETLEEYDAMAAQPDKFFPIISPRFISPEFTRAVDEFRVLLNNGDYELSAAKGEKPKRVSRRKRNHVEAEEDLVKKNHNGKRSRT